jgi:glycosyltransferase involved in cell wall biosynthesis
MKVSSEKPHISIVIPVYYGQGSLDEMYRRLTLSLEKVTTSYEIIFVNDCSPDKSWVIIKELAEKDCRVKGINLSRNFGQHYAITAGLDHVAGEWVVVMDCDLQDQPEEIIKLYQKAQEGFDVVFASRAVRKDGFFKRLSSILFFKVFDYLTDSKTDNTIANYSIASRKIIEEFKRFREQYRSYPLFVKWMGFKMTAINVEHAERYDGKSTYTFTKLFRLAMDSIIAQSNKPLKLSIQIGFMISFLAALYGGYLIYRYLFLSQAAEGWTSVMVSIYFIAGLIFANLGMVGLYIGKIFDETKGRPIYIIKNTAGMKESE